MADGVSGDVPSAGGTFWLSLSPLMASVPEDGLWARATGSDVDLRGTRSRSSVRISDHEVALASSAWAHSVLATLSVTKSAESLICHLPISVNPVLCALFNKIKLSGRLGHQSVMHLPLAQVRIPGSWD